MKEYIEHEAAIAVIEEKQKELCPVGMYSRHAVYGSDREKFDAWEEIIEAIEAIPAADARPVVLCKDCMYAPSGTDGGEVRGFALEWPHDEWPEDNPCPCKCEDGWYSHKPKPDFFCANGKREES